MNQLKNLESKLIRLKIRYAEYVKLCIELKKHNHSPSKLCMDANLYATCLSICPDFDSVIYDNAYEEYIKCNKERYKKLHLEHRKLSTHLSNKNNYKIKIYNLKKKIKNLKRKFFAN